MITSDQLADILALGHEQRGVEFKGPGSTGDTAFRAKVIRAGLGLTNRRDGGYIIVGINDKIPASGGPGLDPQQVIEWTNYDNLATWFGEYADPAFRFEVVALQTRQGHTVVAIEVLEFEEIPVLCKRDFGQTLKRGALYTRSHARPETSDTHQHAELRELVDLAIEKGLRRFVERAALAGVSLHPAESLGAGDVEAFADQLPEDLA